ncbi:hypothetical protein BVC80_1657g26 [Macleaya cordata]|uniref:Uncharacterized protein n=1 Tax=Macleaya cordata TaxID=56857 RepID=A0A200PSN2_MACCD|nr:hypothetical protein BVC80_1657g26 [Macleaya cordata]
MTRRKAVDPSPPDGSEEEIEGTHQNPPLERPICSAQARLVEARGPSPVNKRGRGRGRSHIPAQTTSHDTTPSMGPATNTSNAQTTTSST